MEPSRYSDFWKFLKLMSDNDLLKHVVVIGSWAEFLYAQAGILPGFMANIRTLDIDFLVKNMRKPSNPTSLVTLAKEAGYTIDSDYLSGCTKIYTPDAMEIEFLILQQGSGETGILKTNLGVNAQALRHLSILRDNTIHVCLFDMRITVPEPEAYVIHKIIINDKRGTKAEKDRLAIINMRPYLNEVRFTEMLSTLTAIEMKKVRSFKFDPPTQQPTD